MAFSFGATPAPAPGGAAAPAPSFSFGGAAATAASGAPAPAAAPGGFSFGTGGSSSASAPVPAPAPAPAASGGFNLGGSAPAPAQAAPAATTQAPAPASGGAFSFGSSPAAATPAPAAGGGAFGFGGGSKPAAPATRAFATTTTTSSIGLASTNTSNNAATIPDFESIFPNLQMLSKIRRLLPKVSEPSDEGSYAGQELYHILQTNQAVGQQDKSLIGSILAKPQPLTFKPRDDAFRQKLQTNPTVTLHGKEAGLTPQLLAEMWKLADDLRISEADAMALYAKASELDTRMWVENRLQTSYLDNNQEQLRLGNDVPKAARELFFYERSSSLTTLLLLLQHRIQQNPALLAATDHLICANLVDNLCTVVKEYTRLADGLEQERAARKVNAATPMFGVHPAPDASAKAKGPEETFATVLLKFAYDQRHVAATCLFYLMYHTQCTAAEVATVIDLIKELTNGTNSADPRSGLPLLDPFVDVPSAFEGPKSPMTPAGPWGTPFTQALPPLKEKDALLWHKELVENTWNETSGKPQLLQCVSALCIAVISALDSRQILVDRNTHGPNEFGPGNALLRQTCGIDPIKTEQLRPIHTRLDPSNLDPVTHFHKDWKRQDIWGLLAASYALLLCTVAQGVASPRMGNPAASPSLGNGAIDIKATWRACLEVPTFTKSFSFARLCAMPSFPRHSTGPDGNCNDYEFFMAVLADFISQYLEVLCASGDVPISRAKWENDEQTELEIQKNERERQKHFQSWSGTIADEELAIPTDVDLLKRPDCMDDVMALAVAVSSAGPEFANYFWSIEEEEVETNEGIRVRRKLLPSTALKTLERIQKKDTSLMPAYISFLAALALANDPDDSGNGAAAVHEMLSVSSSGLTWMNIIGVIRWYVHQMSQSEYGGSSNKTVTTETLGSNTARYEPTEYYYAGDRGAERLGDQTSGSSQQQEINSSSADSKPKEMSETNTMILSSYLNIITTVASNCREARSAIVSIALPLDSGVGEDPALTVLFFLAMCPLSPEVRGAVFVTISSLLRTSAPTKDEKEWARKAWGFLEESQTLPIALLYQYANTAHGIGRIASEGIRFPPSSTRQVGTGAEAQFATQWIPPEPKFGILYEMEQVESRMGFYPSTEGLLHLITTLVSVSGCPSDLGRNWRLRSGCTPYIEYVAHFVLPRAMGLHKKDGGLPFRTLADKSRLVSLALEVVEAAVCRYTPPPPSHFQSVPSLTDESKKEGQQKTPSIFFGLSSVDSSIFVTPENSEAADYRYDYRDLPVSSIPIGSAMEDPSFGGLLTNNTGSINDYDTRPVAVAGESSFPAPKSPGFSILADIFSSVNSDLFQSLIAIMSMNSASRGIHTSCGLPEYESYITEALFGETVPTFRATRTKESKKTQLTTTPYLLRPPFPSGCQTVYGNVDGKGHSGLVDGVFWRERSVILCLRILCAAAAREEEFIQAVNAISPPLKIVPVIRFNKLGAIPSGIESFDVQVSRLETLLAASAGITAPRNSRIEAVPTIVEYIGYVASNIEYDANLASAALGLLVYINKVLPAQKSLHLLCSNSSDGAKSLTAAVSQRLDASSKRLHVPAHAEMVDLILDLILKDLRSGDYREMNLSDIMLGFPLVSEVWKVGHTPGAHCAFSLVLNLLSDFDFVQRPETTVYAAKCYEIIYRLTCVQNIDRSTNVKRILHVAETLRSMSFWRNHLLRFLGNRRDSTSLLEDISSSVSLREGDDHLLHCVSWLLKGVANELRILMGLPVRHSDPLSGLAAPQPSKCRELLTLLYGGQFNLVLNALNILPLSNREREIMKETSVPQAEVVKASILPLMGADEVVRGKRIISLDKLLQQMFLHHEKGAVTVERTLTWAKQWNETVSWECAVSHLAESMRISISCSFVYCNSVLLGVGNEMSSVFQNTPPPLDTRGLVRLLSLIVDRITPERNNGPSFPGMDESLYSSATLSLSLAAFGIVKEIVDTLKLKNISIAEGDALRIALLLAKAIVFSAGGAADSPISERTAVLGSSLALLMQFVCESDPGLSSNGPDRDVLLRAAVILSRLACNPVNGLSNPDLIGEQTAAVALMSRAALSALFRCHNDDAAIREESFIAQTFEEQRDTLSSMAMIVRTLDDNIFLLLEQIALRCFGTELLQDSGLPRALIDAATAYSKEEARVKGDYHGTTPNIGSYRTTRFGMPSFFSGHVSLLNSMLVTPDLHQERRARLAADAADFICQHSTLVDRLLSTFPEYGDVTMECMRCLNLTLASLTDGDKSDGRPSFSNLDYGGPGRLLRDNAFISLESRVLDLAYHISQFPFPRRMLPSLPPTLKNANDAHRSERHIVSVTSTEQRTWWDAVEGAASVAQIEMPFPPTGPSDLGGWQANAFPGENATKWSDQKYEFSIDSAEILESCLSYLNQRIMLSPSLTIDWSALAAGFCRCADAARAMEGRLRNLQNTSSGNDLVASLLRADLMDTSDRQPSARSAELELKYLSVLGPLLGRCAEKILALSSSHARSLARESYSDGVRKSTLNLSNAMLASFDHTRVESMGIGCVGLPGEENKREFAKKIASSLRKVLEAQLKHFE